MAALAAAIGAAPWLQPNPVLDFGPFDLSQGASRTVTFRAAYSELYALGLQMDQRSAKRLIPCWADMQLSAEHQAQCKTGGAPAWPVALSFSLWRGDEDISRDIELSRETAGGEYGGDHTYTWQPASVDLQRGETYALKVRTLRDASHLAEAHPHLVAEVISPGFGDRAALTSFAATAAALGLLFTAVIWFVHGWTEVRPRQAAA